MWTHEKIVAKLTQKSTTVPEQTVTIPDGTESASVYVDSEGKVHLADINIKVGAPWYKALWVVAMAFIAGIAVSSIFWLVLK